MALVGWLVGGEQTNSFVDAVLFISLFCSFGRFELVENDY